MTPKEVIRIGLAALLAVSLLAVSCDAVKTECYVNSAGDPLDPNNIYKCAKEHTCCREEGKPSCCRKKESSVAVWEQITLWGTLIGFILVLAIVIWCCRHDGDCCCNDKDGRKSCCGKPFGKKPDDNFVDQDKDGNEVFSDKKKDKHDEDDDDDDDDDDNTEKKKKPDDIRKDVSKSAKEKMAIAPSSPTTLSRPGDLPPSYSNLELDDIV